MKTERTLSLIIAAVIPFPLLLTGIASTYEKIPAELIAGGLAGALIAWVAGDSLGALLNRIEGKKIYIIRILTVAAGVVTALLSEIVIFSLKMGSLAIMFIPAAYTFWLWLGVRAGSRQNVIYPIVLGGY